MSKDSPALECYIGVVSRQSREDFFEVHGFSREVIMFSIPAYGVLFKCCAGGTLIDLEFGAFFALLRFVKTSLAKERIRKIRVYSSEPRFVYALVNRGPLMAARRGRKRMFESYLSRFDIEVRLIPQRKNQASTSPVCLPSTPRGQVPPIRPRTGKQERGRIRPLQKGIQI